MAGQRKLTVVIAGDTKGLTSAVGEAESALSSFGSKAGPILGGVAAGLTALVGIGVGVVKMAYDLGASFDAAYDSIQIATGATGEELERFKDVFRDIATDTPAGFEDIATAVGMLNQRLDLTGTSLEQASEQLLDFTRLTGSDTASAINLVTRLMGDWALTGDDVGLTLDKLFVAQQESGVGWEMLADQVVQFGAPLRQLGFDLDTSIALLAKFNAEGVNTELVMGSMRIALSRLTKAEESDASTVRSSTNDRRAQARAIADANRAIEDAAKGIVEANEQVIESQKELDELLKGPSADDKEEATLSQAEAQLDLEKANRRVLEAQKKLSKAQEDEDPEAVAEATLEVRDAQLALTRSQRASTKATEELNRVTNWNADADAKVTAAKEDLKSAQERVVDAQDRAVQAQERLVDAQTRSIGSAGGAAKETSVLEQTIKRLGLETAPTEEKYAALVEEIKNSQDPIAAARLGMELFGARAGADMVAAIREGRFDGLAPLVADLQGAGGTVGQTASDTEDFSERFQIAMNKLKLAVEPIVMRLFEWFGEELAPVIERVAAAMEKDGLGGAIEELRKIAEENWPAIEKAINNALQAVLDWMIDHVDEFFELGVQIGWKIVQGIQSGLLEAGFKNIPGAEELLGGIASQGNVLSDPALEKKHNRDYNGNGIIGKHSGGMFRSPNGPGTSGFAWLQDGERVTRPAHGGGESTTVIVKISEETLVAANARYDKRGVATVIAG